METQQTVIKLPIKGYHIEAAYEEQPEGTSPSMSNVVPYDVNASYRLRISQRDGTSKTTSVALGSGNPIRCLHLAARAATAGGVTRAEQIAAVANGNIYLSNDPTSFVLATGGSAALNASVRPTAADAEGKVIFVDGLNNPKVLTQSTNTVATLAASAGSLPSPCKIVAIFRTRLVLANDDTNPQNIYMSRAGTITDFDYSQTDVQAAVALNASSTAGRIGEPVTALIPFRDDVMIIGGDHSLYAMKGDPADGGSILTLSESAGIINPNAYAFDPEGNLYFVSRHGLFRLSPESDASPEDLSTGRVSATFLNYTRSASDISMAWDADRKGLYIFFKGVAGGTAMVGIWYDRRTGGFFPLTYPSNHGGIATLYYAGEGGTYGWTLVAGSDGHLRRVGGATNDDGTAISSFVYAGPIRPGGVATEATLTDLQFQIGQSISTESLFSVAYQVYAGPDPYTAMINGRSFSGTLALGDVYVNPHVRNRLRGMAFWVRLGNSTLDRRWTMEQITASFAQGGKPRHS